MNIQPLDVTGLCLSLTAFCVALRSALHKAKTTSSFFAAQNRLYDWQRQNPNTDFKDSQEGTSILLDFVDASQQFVKTVQPGNPETIIEDQKNCEALLK